MGSLGRMDGRELACCHGRPFLFSVSGLARGVARAGDGWSHGDRPLYACGIKEKAYSALPTRIVRGGVEVPGGHSIHALRTRPA